MVIQWGPAANAPAPINPNGANNLVQQMQNFWQAHGGQITAGGIILVGIASQFGGSGVGGDAGGDGAELPISAEDSATLNDMLAEQAELQQDIWQAYMNPAMPEEEIVSLMDQLNELEAALEAILENSN